jgi:putative Holliday junction resolvase
VTRYLGLDYGDATIGIAVSCPRGIVATGVETLRRSDPAAMKPTIARLRKLIAEYGITHVVLGYPRHMDGNVSTRCEKTEAFAERLKRNFKRINIDFWDERLSTQAVRKMIRNDNHIDEMAAVFILQGFLDYRNTEAFKMDEQIIMLDEDGNGQPFDILASKESNGTVYLLAVEAATDDSNDEAEIVHFKCIATEGDDMVFESVDDDHEDFEFVLALFEADYEALDIIIEE